MSAPLSDLMADVLACIRVGSVAAISGPPGVGKSALGAAIARIIGGDFVTIIGSQAESTDLNGFPVIVPEQFEIDSAGRKHPTLSFAPREPFVRLQKNGGLLFFDELTCAPQSLQAAMLRILNDWVCGDFQLDRTRVGIIVAYNPAEYAVNGQELAGPTLNRLAHFEYPTDSDAVYEWCSQFPGYWGNPPPLGFGNQMVSPDSALRARSYVAGYIQRTPDKWLDARYKPKREQKEKQKAGTLNQTSPGFATPRSWHRVSNHLALCLENNQPTMSALRRIAAEIGPGEAAEFQTYMQQASLPDPEHLLANPDKYTPSGRLDIDFSTTMAVTAAFEAKPTGPRYVAAWKVIRGAVSKAGNSGGAAYEAGMAGAMRLTEYFSGEKASKLRGDLDPTAFAEVARDTHKIAKPFMGLISRISEGLKT